jgi:hypothetical protein
LPIRDASVDNPSVRIRRVYSHENRLADPRYGVEFLRHERPIVAKGGENSLMNPKERDVVISRRDHYWNGSSGPLSKLLKKRLSLSVLPDLGPLCKVTGQDDDIRCRLSGQSQKIGRYTRAMRFAEVYV